VDALGWIEDHPGLAAWVQAIGTIGALVIAIWLPVGQRRATERASAIAARSVVTEALSALTVATKYRYESANDGPREIAIEQQLEMARQSLASFPVHSLSDGVVPLFQALRDAFFMCARGFTDRRVGKLGFLILRRKFLHTTRDAAVAAPGMLDAMEGLFRAIVQADAECTKLAEQGVDPAQW
jgi:hypothetical protein